jgi:hypothetical protein
VGLLFDELSAAPAEAQTRSCVRIVPGIQPWFIGSSISCPGIEVQTSTIELTSSLPVLSAAVSFLASRAPAH